MRNRQDNAHKGLSPLSADILGYLAKNPLACDTLLGIARWWVLKQRIEAITTEVKGAIDELLALGLLVQTRRSHGQPLYTLNRKKLAECRALLTQPNKNSTTQKTKDI